MAAAKAIRFGPQLKELRIHLCQKSSASQGARNFIEENYVQLKTENPKIPILVRECSGIQPKLWARYEYGRELSVNLADKSSKRIMSDVQQLCKKI